MPEFAIIALDGFYELSNAAMRDSFTLVCDRVEQLFDNEQPVKVQTRLKTVSIDGRPVRSANGLELTVDGRLDELTEISFIWLPAFRALGVSQLRQRIADSADLLETLREHASRGTMIGASGSAILMLSAAGLTSRIPVPMARPLRPLARSLLPRQPLDDRAGIADHGAIMLSSGPAFDLPLLCRAIGKTFTPSIARWLGSVTGLDRDDVLSPLSPDPIIADAQIWLEQNFARRVVMSDLADAVSVTLSTLNRRFRRAIGMSPGEYLMQVRIRFAKSMLENSDRSVEDISEMVGFSNSRIFRSAFSRQVGRSPLAWRKAVRVPKPRAE